MFAAYEKCSRPTFAPEEKCLRPMKNGAEKERKRKEKIGNQKLERKQLNDYNFQRDE
jgi:hypothetical protein